VHLVSLQEWTLTFRLSLLVAVLFALVSPASAQTSPEGMPAKARFRIGRINLNPTIALTNAGVDDNVFNAADVNDPKSDFTMTATPHADAWFQVGRAWVTSTIREDFVYYRVFAEERSVNSSYRGTVSVPFNRLTVNTSADYLNTRDRPGYEIDARSRHTEDGIRGAAEYRAFGKTFVAATVERSNVAFDPDALYLGRSLRRELNRTLTSAGLSVRHQLTPVTSLALLVRREQDRFEFSPVRDSDSTRVDGTMTFNARIRGSASVGYRNFQPISSDVQPYKGATASIDMTVAPFGSTRVGIRATRDLQYSYDVEQPYYVETGTGFSLTQGLSGPLDVVGRVQVQDLSYRGRIGGSLERQDRTDSIYWFGGGIGYRVGRDMRIGFNVDKQHRTSDLAAHGYEGLRYGTSVTYGF
jgi:hypothetical protein